MTRRRAGIAERFPTSRLLQLFTLLLVSCTALVPPEVGEPPETSTTTIPGPTKRLFLSSRQEYHGTGDQVFDLVASDGDTGSMIAPPGGREFVELFAWQTPVGSGIVGSTVDTSIRVIQAEGVVYRWRIRQLDQCGNEKAASAYSPVLRGGGQERVTIDFATSWETGDMLRLSLEVREPDDRGEFVEVGLGEDSWVQVQASSLDSSQVEMVLDTPAQPAAQAPYVPAFTGDLELAGSDTAGLPNNEFRWNNLRVFWWNDYRKRWDGILPTAQPPAEEASDWWLWKDLAADRPQPSFEVSGRTVNTPDTFWDQSCASLYVFMGRGAEGRSRFFRYRYHPETDSYASDTPPAGVEVPEDLRGPKRVSIIRSPRGHLWASVNQGNRLLVSRSIDGGLTWPDPVSITPTHGDGDTHWVVYEEGGVTRVAVAATEDGSIPGSRVRFLSIDENGEWRIPSNWVDESGLIPGNEGDEQADDELSAIYFRGEVYLANETEPGPLSRRNASPQLLLFRRDATGSWTKFIITRFERDGAADRKRPVISADAEQGRIIVGVGRGDRSVASLFFANVDALDQWTELEIFAVGGAAGETIYNVWLPRYAVTSERGLLAMVEEVGTTSDVWRQVIVTGEP